ncbi:MAG: amidohydrolase family protein [Methylovulum sp.]|nr:amidohydrolase family protein [Methylovulum sp.]
MKFRSRLADPLCLSLTMLLCQGASFNALAHGEVVQSCQLLIAKQLFDGVNFPQANMAVLIEGGKVKQVGKPGQLRGLCANSINLGDATILPGFIESHAHITFQNVSKAVVLEHGITTAQDTGGPLMAPTGGQGKLRLLSTGPIIQAPGGYPLNIFGGSGGYDKIGYPVLSVLEAEEAVQHIVDGGATAIKVALEPGGEAGAPWMMPHDGPVPATPWDMPSEEIVQAIVAKAHALNKRVIAHVGEDDGFERALNSGVDEFAHMPCSTIREDLLQRAVDQGVTFVTTVDTLSSCQGIHGNMMSLAGKGAKFIYGSEIAHDNVPWGINGEEMHLMLHLGSGASIDFTDVVNVFKAATSEAGEHLGLAPLGSLAAGAPADIIAVRGNPFQRFKILEYPDLVMSGGHIIVNKFHKKLAGN